MIQLGYYIDIIAGISIIVMIIVSLWFWRKAIKLSEPRFFAAYGYGMIAFIIDVCSLIIAMLLLKGVI